VRERVGREREERRRRRRRRMGSGVISLFVSKFAVCLLQLVLFLVGKFAVMYTAAYLTFPGVY